MAKKYISKYTGPEIDSGLDNIPKLEGKLTELESKIEGGTGGGTSGTGSEEIYIGNTEPTDDNIKVWINPSENPSNDTTPGTTGGETGGGYFTYYIGTDQYLNVRLLTPEYIASFSEQNTDGRYDEFIALANKLMEENEKVFAKIRAGEKIQVLGDTRTILDMLAEIEFELITDESVMYLLGTYEYANYEGAEDISLDFGRIGIVRSWFDGIEQLYEVLLAGPIELGCPAPGENSITFTSNIETLRCWARSQIMGYNVLVSISNGETMNLSYVYPAVYVDTSSIDGVTVRWWYGLKLCESTINAETGEASTTIIKDLEA